MITVPSLPSPQAVRASAPGAGRRGPALLAVTAAIVAVLAGGGIFVWLLTALVFPIISASRQNSLRARSAANLRAIVAAMRSYEAEYNSLPPALVIDENGRPLHSWRVLILPFLGCDHVYRRYDFAQPWDSPQNMQLLSLMPAEYASPADPDALSRYETSYMVVVGAGTAFPGEAAVGTGQIGDGLGQTMLVAETVTSGVSWLEPRDLQAARMQYVINGRAGVEIGSRLEGGAHVGLANGTTQFLLNETPPEYVQALTTIAGNEAVPWFAAD